VLGADAPPDLPACRQKANFLTWINATTIGCNNSEANASAWQKTVVPLT
jgi:hypothetical protein